MVFGVAGLGLVLAKLPLPRVDVPVETTFLLDANNNKLAELSAGENRVSVPLEQVSPHLVDAVLAAEDRDFFKHSGVDLSAIVRATWADLRGRPLQGGSTITQQYVKYVYTDRERTFTRKLKEATLAIKLENRLDKEQILERYLNVIYFGRGAYGVQAASRAYFGRDVSELDVPRAAYLAGLIRAPEVADASRDPAMADQRRDVVLTAMEREGHISGEQRSEMEAVPVAAMEGFRPREDAVEDRIVGGHIGTQHFVEYVRAQLLERYGEDVLYGGGLRVHTSLDPRLQEAAFRSVYGTLDRPDDPAGALVALDAAGHVKAMVGGRQLQPDGEQSPYAKVNFALGKEGGGSGRQPGSAFKPFVLAEAVGEGYSVESAFPSPAKVVFPGANAGADYTVRNYDNAGYGTQNLIEATRVSSNTVYAQLARTLGLDEVAETARRLGIRAEIPDDQLSVALGTVEVSVLDMADAYLTFATRGVQVDPVGVTSVTDGSGRVIDEFTAERERVLEPEEADVVNFVLEGVVESGTGTRAKLGRPLAGKTGTTQDNGDAWFIGYTPGLSAAVWMGYPEGQAKPMSSVHGVEVTGGSIPADMFRKFMSEALRIEDDYGGDFVAPRTLGGKLLSGARQAYVDPDAAPPTTAVEERRSTTTAPADPTPTTAPTTTTSPPRSTTTTTTPPPAGAITLPTTTTAPSEPREEAEGAERGPARE